MRLVGTLLASLLFYGCGSTSEGPVFIDIADDFSRISINDISGLPNDKYKEHFQVFVAEKHRLKPDQSPMVGLYTTEGQQLHFEPIFPFYPGITYVARFKQGEEWLEREFLVPDIDRQPVNEVVQVYPTSQRIPLNILKFYIQFSDSMAMGFAYDNIDFVNEAGDTLQDVYLPLEEELWSPDMKRFTLLLDPGRIKRGLRSQEELGYVFDIGKQYKLVVNKNWHDANDRPLQHSFSKSFRIEGYSGVFEDNLVISQFPPKGSTEVLKVKSQSILDYALMQNFIRVFDAEGNELSGTVAVSEEETVWEFTPDQPWSKGKHTLLVSKIIEDLAGNNMINPFDVDNQEQETIVMPVDGYLKLSFWPEEE